MNEQTISQRNAAENAWYAAQIADEKLRVLGDQDGAEAYCTLAQAWAAVASQLQFVVDDESVGGTDGRWLGGRWYQNSATSLSTATETAPPFPRPLRDAEVPVKVGSSVEQLEQTVSLPRVVEPQSARPALCHCFSGGSGSHPYSEGRCR